MLAHLVSPCRPRVRSTSARSSTSYSASWSVRLSVLLCLSTVFAAAAAADTAVFDWPPKTGDSLVTALRVNGSLGRHL